MPFIELEQNSPEWLEFRKSKIGMSEVATIMGLNPYKNRKKLWMQRKGLVAEDFYNVHMAAGHAFEERARARLLDIAGFHFEPRVCLHPTIDYLMASLDGYAPLAGVHAEIKYSNSGPLEDARRGKVTRMYWAQMQGQMDCVGSDECYYFIGNEYEEYQMMVLRDDDFIQNMREQVSAFWESLKLDVCPVFAQGTEMQSEEWFELEAAYAEVKKKEKELSKEVDFLKKRFELLSEGKSAYGSRYSYSESERQGSVDLKAMEAEGIDVEKYRKKSTKLFTIREIRHGNAKNEEL